MNWHKHPIARQKAWQIAAHGQPIGKKGRKENQTKKIATI
jgi:hypothetical protein